MVYRNYVDVVAVMTSRTFVAVVNKVSSCSSVVVVDDAVVVVDSEAVADDDDLDEVVDQAPA